MSLRPVYSVNLLDLAGLTGISPNIGPVTGAVIVVRDIVGRADTGVTGDTLTWLNPSGGIIQAWRVGGSCDADFKFHWEGRLVVPVGAVTWFQVFQGTWGLTVSGYELPTP